MKNDISLSEMNDLLLRGISMGIPEAELKKLQDFISCMEKDKVKTMLEFIELHENSSHT